MNTTCGVSAGVGHPLSAGSASVDYSIISTHMTFRQMPLKIGNKTRGASVKKCLLYLRGHNISALSLSLGDIGIERNVSTCTGGCDKRQESTDCFLAREGTSGDEERGGGGSDLEQTVVFQSLGSL